MDALARTTVVLLVAAAALAPPAFAGSTPSPEQAVADLNAWRAQVGVDPVTHDPAKSEGCRLHAEYWRRNHVEGHFEDPSRPGYTPAGDGAAASSVLYYGPASGPRDWELMPYHRTGLLNPRLRSAGYWGEFGLGCLYVGDYEDLHWTPSVTSYSWPADGQRGVPPTFTCNETPNPCTSVPGNPGDRPTGAIPTVQVNGPSSYFRVYGATASLVPDGGGPVAITVEDGNSPRGGYLDGGLALIPHRPLAPDRWYTASVTGAFVDLDAEGEPRTAFARTWRFRTGGNRGRGGGRRARTGLRVRKLRRRGRTLRFTLRGGKARGRRASYYLTFGRREWMEGFRKHHVKVRRRRHVRIRLSPRALRAGRATLYLTVRQFTRRGVRYRESSVERTVRW
ncbi:MAG TPA: CAP domain-containing protein [Solirubrobacteraceae bacterium]|nr:CAP domain-containing protein [Solirubrobacteraceae bacterium]